MLFISILVLFAYAFFTLSASTVTGFLLYVFAGDKEKGTKDQSNKSGPVFLEYIPYYFKEFHKAPLTLCLEIVKSDRNFCLLNMDLCYLQPGLLIPYIK